MTKFLNNADVTGYISQTSVTSSLLKTDANGKLVAAVAGTDYNAPDVSAVAGTLIREIRNTTGATLTKGTVVYISGATGNKATVSKAIATGDSTSAQTFGLCQTDIANNSNGYVVCVGDITGLDTSAFTEGVQLYLSSTTAGAYTSTKQYAPAHLVYIGVVTRSHPTLGQIEVKIQNGYELDEIHDVAISSKANNDFIVYESATSLWKNKSISTVLGYTPANGANYVPYSGATSAVNLGIYALFTSGAYIAKVGTQSGAIFFQHASGGTLAPSGYSAIGISGTDGIVISFNGSSNTITLKNNLLSAARAYSLPDASGTLALTSDLSAYLPLTGGTLTGGLYINPNNASTVGLDVASDTIRFRSDNVEGFKRQLTTTMGSGTLVKMQAAGYGGTYVTDLGFYTSSNSAVNTTPNLYLTGGDNRVGINTTTPGYTLDVDGTGRYTGALIANSFVKNGGTSAQFLMADGSISLGATATARTEQIFTATSGQTTFTVTGGYVVGLVDVYVNGVKLLPSDFTATNSSTVVLATGAVLNDSVTIINYTATIAALPTSRDTIDYTATSAQTTFTVSGGYAVGLLDVYVNGVKLTSSEYTATNGTTFVLSVASVTGDQVQAIRYNASITGVSGSGTANYIPKFTASATLANSLIQDDGTNVIIGSTNSALLMPRAATSNDASINFSTNGTTSWNVGLRSTYSGEDFYIWNPVFGIPYITLSSASSLANFGVAVRASSYNSYIGSGIFMQNASAGTNSVYMRVNNTGGDLRTGIESSAGGALQTGTSAYAAVFGNHANYSTQFTTNGTVRMTIDAGGNVSIGTTTADKLLTLYSSAGSLDTGAVIRLIGNTANDLVDISVADTKTRIYHQENSADASAGYGIVQLRTNASGNTSYPTRGGFQFTVGSTDAMFISNLGNVGIGATPGPNRVEIGGPQNEWTLSTTANTTTGQSYGAIIRGGTNSTDIAFRVNNAANNTTYLTVNGNGNVGIGTASPSVPLALSNSASAMFSINSTDANGGYMRFERSGSIRGYIGSGYHLTVGGSNLDLTLANDAGNITFVTSTSFTERMRITSGGKVAIGMTDSAYGTVAIKSNNTTAYMGLNVYALGNGNFTYMNHNNNVGIIGTEFGSGGTGHTDLTFQTGGGEKLRIQTSGVLNLLGDSTATSSADTFSLGVSSTSHCWIQTWGGRPLRINELGNNVYAYGSAGYGLIVTTSSDARIKKNIVPVTNGLSKVMALNGVYYEFDENNELGVKVPFDKQRIGLIAQDVEAVIPEAVINDVDINMPKSIDYGGMVGLLIKAIQELKAELDTLKNA